MSQEDLAKLKIDKAASFKAPGNRKRSGYLIVAVIAIVLFGVFYFSEKAVEVEVVTVSQIYPSQAFTMLNASGYIVAQRKAAVASKATGRLVALMAEEGSRVKKGDVLAQLENNDVSAIKNQAAANLEAAKSNLDQAKAELHDALLSFNRQKELLAQELITRAGYESAEARYKKGQAAVASSEASVKASAAALREAEVSVEYTFIRSPFDAVVLTKNADIGDIVTPLGAAANAKAAVVSIADMESLLVEADVSETNIGKIRTGQPCEIILDAIPDSRFQGAVHMIVPTADRTKASVMVKVRFKDKDTRILPEMSAKVAFLERVMRSDEHKPRTAITPSAIEDRNGKRIVFLIKNSLAAETPVKTGETFGGLIEVIEGVKAGDKLILNPSSKLKDGTKITVKEN